jgi:lysine-ketoglutarate reductase/saccharopine dehydrogenase-like protein (TIGR00300 family)
MPREEITIEGHIIDSLVFTRVLDDIVQFGGDFQILEVNIGRGRHDRSHARIEVSADSVAALQELMNQLSKHGAMVVDEADVRFAEADMDGAFPPEFYATTNQTTRIRHRGQWHDVFDQEMDCGIKLDPDGTFRCVPMLKVRKGDKIVIGHLGVKVVPIEKARQKGVFEFMSSEISTEKPKSALIRNCARLLHRAKQEKQRVLLVAGPAVVHTGSVPDVVHMIERGLIDVIFAGNALAVHDIESALYGTSLGVYVDKATLADTGHEHHLRAINAIRRCGGIPQAVEQGVLTNGIMHACVQHDVEYVLAGSIRDDGPLPDVMTDVVQAQQRMREIVTAGDVGFALMVATGLHSIATGNLLPAWIPAVCVDIQPMILTKLGDRGSFQTIGLVTDVAPFFRELITELNALS